MRQEERDRVTAAKSELVGFCGATALKGFGCGIVHGLFGVSRIPIRDWTAVICKAWEDGSI
jgi:hypothetical protein